MRWVLTAACQHPLVSYTEIESICECLTNCIVCTLNVNRIVVFHGTKTVAFQGTETVAFRGTEIVVFRGTEIVISRVTHIVGFP